MKAQELFASQPVVLTDSHMQKRKAEVAEAEPVTRAVDGLGNGLAEAADGLKKKKKKKKKEKRAEEDDA